ncbi:uncharacterized protein [Periplaneta americana]|uniref:uncharacterized protein n=1 Tax=Periplaneta americana TaxID=6978 RepID=UPI0037E905E0
MATKQICTVLLVLFALQNGSAFGSLVNDFITDTVSNINKLKDLAEKVVDDGNKALDDVKNQSQSVLNSAKKEVDNLLQNTTNIIQTKASGLIGNAIKIGQCVQTAIAAATKDAATGFKNITACVTDEVNAIVNPLKDLIAKGQKALTFASDLLKNFSSCLPNGLSSIGLTELMCLLSKIGSLGTDITSTITSLINDIQSITTALSNFRNAVVRCPRERIGDLVSAFGNDITNFGNCANAANAAR